MSPRNSDAFHILEVMPAIDNDEIKIQHALPGRPQSPALERTARLAVEAAFGELISRKLLYQKVTIDLSGLSQAIASSELTTPDQLLLLETEVAARPWELETHHQGDNPIHLPIFASANVGGQPIGTPLNQMNIHFCAPGCAAGVPNLQRRTNFHRVAIVSAIQLGAAISAPIDTWSNRTSLH